MAVRTITAEQCEDRLEWLIGSAGFELNRALRDAHDVGDRQRVIEVLDAVKHAAEQCAKHLRHSVERPTSSSRAMTALREAPDRPAHNPTVQT